MNRIPLMLVLVGVAACGTDVSGPSASLLSCALGEPTLVSAGDVLQVRGEANHDVCLSPGDGGAGDFVFIPFFGASPATGDAPERTLELEVSGVGIHGIDPALRAMRAAPPVLLDRITGARTGPDRLHRDRAFHDRLRQREIDELQPLIRPTGAAGPAARLPSLAGPLPEVGDLLRFNTAVSCTARDTRTGRVMYVSDHAVVVADTATPVDLEPADYAYFGVTFDTLVHPVETAHFGEPSDIDGNGRAILFFTPAVNERNPRDAESVIIGFFWSGDLFPETETARLQACPEANQAEMFYLIAPDPGGEIGPAFTLERVRSLAIPLIGHEFQHLINASRRLFVNEALVFEETWLNEGLSHAAEELLFYAAAGVTPGMNLDAQAVRDAPGGAAAFNEYVSPNFSNFRDYLVRPDTASLMGEDQLATRGASWAFLRYAADRAGEDGAFFFDLVNSREAGLDNLAEVLAPAAPLDWMRDWTVALYGDDRVPGLDTRFQTLSWNYRDVFQESTVGAYPLSVQTLVPDVSTDLELLAGGTAFLGFAVPAGERAVIRGTSGGAPPPGGLRGSFLRWR